jgi:hypothetical protein
MLKLHRYAPGAFSLFGRELPAHLGRAWGRHIFALLHLPPARAPKRAALWLRDLPLGLAHLHDAFGFREPLQAYYAECVRTGTAPDFAVSDYLARIARAQR